MKKIHSKFRSKVFYFVKSCQLHDTFPAPACLSSAGSNGSQQQQQQNQQPDLRIRRQHSSDSVSSITSATSHSSVGSNMDADAKNKKKNKKNWVRCCFQCVWVTNKQAGKSHGLFLSLSLCAFLCVGVTCLCFSSSGLFHWGKGEHIGFSTQSCWRLSNDWFDGLQVKCIRQLDENWARFGCHHFLTCKSPFSAH